MHIADSFKKVFGVKATKPFVADSFVAVPSEKYVVWHVDKMGVDQYDHAPIVVKMLGLPVVKCGAGIRPISMRELAYVIKNAEVVISSSVISSEMAGIFNKKTVCLFGNRAQDTTTPYFRPDSMRILSGSDKPSFLLQEDKKSINNIRPEDVTNAVLELFGDRRRITSRTVSVGNKFCLGQKIFVYPRTEPKARIQATTIIVDNSSDMTLVNSWASATDNPSAIILEGEVDISKFKMVTICADKASPKIVEQCEKLGVRYELLGLESTENLIHFCDYEVREVASTGAADKTFFDSAAVFFDGEKEFPSLYHLKNRVEKSPPRLTIGHDTRDYRVFGDYYYVFGGPS